MSLPPFAIFEDLDARTPGGVAAADRLRAEAALDDASALIRAEAAKSWVTAGVLDFTAAEIAADVPGRLLAVACAAARRVFENPDNAKARTLGDASVTYSDSSNDVYLTSSEKAMVRKAAGVRSGLWVQPTTRGYLETEPVLAVNGVPERTYPDASEYASVDGGEPTVYYGDEP